MRDSGDDDNNDEERDPLPSLKVALLGGPKVGRTSCLLRFVGMAPGEEHLPTAPVVATAIPATARHRAETGQREITLGGTSYLVRLVAPELAGVSSAAAAIALRGCDGAVAVWSSRGGAASLAEAAAALRAAIPHLPPRAAHCTLLLCNLHAGDDPAALLASPEGRAALAVCPRHCVACAVAPRGTLLGPAAFDGVLRTLLRLADRRLPPLRVAFDGPSAAPPCTALPPSLLSLCVAFLRDHWDAVPIATPRDAIAALPAELHSLVFVPPPLLR